jgi:energy-coupling factor transporter ATP-binding protein EcfA2
MFGFLIGALAVTAVTAINAFICDEITEDERIKQDELRQDYIRSEGNCIKKLNEIERDKQIRIKEITERYSQMSAADSDELKAQIESAQREFEKQAALTQTELRNSLVEIYIKAANDKIARNNILFNDIKTAIGVVKEQLKTQRTTMRGNALTHFLSELSETRQKCRAYDFYLKGYSRYIERNSGRLDIEIGEFDFVLPKNYLYDGKLIYLNTDEIQKAKLAIPYCYDLKFSTNDFDADKYTDVVDSKIPFLCTGYTEYIYNLSIERGIFKTSVLANPRIGIKATVIERNKGGYILSYMDLSMFLPWNKLENPKRTPPIGAELRVFPVDWDITLDNISVSENPTDSLRSYSFSELPLVVPDAFESEFLASISKNRIGESTEEWKIAPYNESELPSVKAVKLQLGTSFVVRASIVTSNDNDCYFRYESVLDVQEYAVKPEDVFAPLDCVLSVVLESELAAIDKTAYENITSLSLWVFTEFKNQYSIKTNQKGMQYFNKWEEVTDKLVTYKYKGDFTTLSIENILIDGKSVTVGISAPDALKTYLDTVYSNPFSQRNVTFFIEANKAEYIFIQKIAANCEHIVFFGEPAVRYFDKKVSDITIYAKNFAYVESQQKNALSKFRVGALTNKILQINALDGATIIPEQTDIALDNLYNEHLRDDDSQFNAVKYALSENNIYLIQGPPGTGKTTVITELIKQFMGGKGRVLIASQANVAVDNVVKRMYDFCHDDIIRIGAADKIAQEIRYLSFDEKYESYVQGIQNKKGNQAFNQNLLNRWIKIVKPQYGQNPDVGELLIRSHRIVGATCIGLAKKKIGLERLTFDLTIIDEAGKALPAELLVPFIRSKKVVIIGDHKQLPPTIDTALLDDEKIEIEDRDVYKDELFDVSFFSRLWDSAPDTNKSVLTTQYRMPTVVGNLISQLFYNSQIENGIGTDNKLSLLPELLPTNITFVDMSDDKTYKENDKGGVINSREALAVSVIIQAIQKSQNVRIAVITPYRPQKRELLRMIRSLPSIKASNVDINTVDAFQGDEAEIVIYCTTRAVKMTPYFSDYRRINVALSRATNNLIIVGSLKYFERYRKYKDGTVVLPEIADYIKNIGTIVDMSHFAEMDSNGKISSNIDLIPFSMVISNADCEVSSEQTEYAKMQYYDYGKFSVPIKTTISNGKYRVADSEGMSIYLAAAELSLSEIEVEILSSKD